MSRGSVRLDGSECLAESPAFPLIVDGVFPQGSRGPDNGSGGLAGVRGANIRSCLAGVPQVMGIRRCFWGWFWLNHAVWVSGGLELCGHTDGVLVVWW